MAERLVVIGGDAAGMTAATNARRGRSDLDIVVFEKGRYTSYSACGIPYLVGGAVESLDDLVVRTPQEFRDKHRIDARIDHEVMGVDLDRRTVEVRAIGQGRTITMGFDLLHIATGASPTRPDLPGIDAPWIRGVQTLTDAADLLERVERGDCGRVVVVGGGYVGLEMAEAFVDRKADVTLVERGRHPLGGVESEIGGRIVEVLRGYGVETHCGVEVTGFGDHVVHSSGGDLEADLVILGLGVTPNSALAADAGIATGVRGAITVDHRQRTSVDGVYSAGDCADTFHLVSRERVHIALGTVANKSGVVAGVNLGGGYATFPGVVGTAVTRVCEVEVARTGLDVGQARAVGIEVVVGTSNTTSRAGYFPGAEPVLCKVLAERGTGRVIGAQIVGADRVGKRIDTMATAITAGMRVADVVNLDLAYAPSITPMWDPVQSASRDALRRLDLPWA
ncbi:MAG: FAD-dependent oxidoreductase [Acidimicrobiales bacterium]|nr:FAD-dependent oxidoreductase [Acidimicrobiales bacterium]